MPILIVPYGFDLTPPQVNSGDKDEYEDDDVRLVEENTSTNDTLVQKSSSESVDIDEMDAWQ